MKTLSDELKEQIFKEMSAALIQRRFADVLKIGKEHIQRESESDQKTILKNFILYLQKQYWPIPLSTAIGGVMALGRNMSNIPENLLAAGQAIIDRNEEQLRRCLLGLPLLEKEQQSQTNNSHVSKMSYKLRRF